MHLRFCLNNKEKKNRVLVSQTKRYSVKGKHNNYNKLIAKILTVRFENNVFDSQPLQYTDIRLEWKQSEVITDSGVKIHKIHSNKEPQPFLKENGSKIQLFSVFGDKISVDFKTLSVSLITILKIYFQ